MLLSDESSQKPITLVSQNNMAKVSLLTAIIFVLLESVSFVDASKGSTFITILLDGKRAYIYHYTGCKVMIKGHNSTFCKRYTVVPTVADFTEDINKAATQLKSDNADLIKRNLENEVNVMIFSDHGMAELFQSHVINITGNIDIADVHVLLDRGATVNIWPKEGKVGKF
ncbi:hypothetical protein KUTeg_011148 [Tegillarca granosa]|uniref:Uncharacterized protein n=1 Tax=Tegillarca granosa TaxID=220873 RepID=A0ABQ9F3Z5_TEGGR|nr:hypothetical protein KUTeg_011148 [Tegillarca granosa]